MRWVARTVACVLAVCSAEALGHGGGGYRGPPGPPPPGVSEPWSGGWCPPPPHYGEGPVVARVLAWVGEEWDPCVLEYHQDVADNPEKTESSAGQVAQPLYTSSLGRFRRELTPKQVRAFERIAGETLEFLGYGLAS